jgi:hypothetical protein
LAEYTLLTEYRGLFESHKYQHRDSTLGDFVAMHLYEDLVTLKKSDRYVLHVTEMSRVLNVRNRRVGIEARRGDGTLGELVPGVEPIVDPGYSVARGPIANVEIGVEVKILSKSMIKQIDRVQGDLAKQVQEFKRKAGSSQPICVAVVGVNFASVATGYEGRRKYRTDGKQNKHPIQEANEAVARVKKVTSEFDELVILRYRATNEKPYAFEWVDEEETRQEYGAALIRISNEYQRRF